MNSVTLEGQSHMRTMWRLSWPAIIEQILTTLVSYVDTAMVGVLGAAGTAAVSVNAAPLWLINGILAGVGVGFSVQVALAIGSKNDHKAKAVIRQSILAVLVCGIVALILYEGLAGFLPKWLGTKPDVLPHAINYLRIYVLAMPFNTAIIVCSAILRCMGNTKAPLLFNTAANLINIVLNFFFIYPTRSMELWGISFTIPGAGLGVEGAAIASAIAIACSGVLMLLVTLRQGERFSIHRGESFRPDRAIMATALSLGLPSALERATINLGQIAMTFVVGQLGTVALAANQIATTGEGLCYLPAYGISYAATALVGQSVGANNRADAKAYGSLSGKLAFLLCVVTGLLLFLLAGPLAALFNTDPAVVSEAARCLRIVSVAEPLFAVSIVLTGALRGAQDVKFPMVVGLIGMWGIRIPLAPVLVFVAGMGVAGVWTAMAIDLSLRGILCALRWRQGKWVRLSGLD